MVLKEFTLEFADWRMSRFALIYVRFGAILYLDQPSASCYCLSFDRCAFRMEVIDDVH